MADDLTAEQMTAQLLTSSDEHLRAIKKEYIALGENGEDGHNILPMRSIIWHKIKSLAGVGNSQVVNNLLDMIHNPLPKRPDMEKLTEVVHTLTAMIDRSKNLGNTAMMAALYLKKLSQDIANLEKDIQVKDKRKHIPSALAGLKKDIDQKLEAMGKKHHLDPGHIDAFAVRYPQLKAALAKSPAQLDNPFFSHIEDRQAAEQHLRAKGGKVLLRATDQFGVIDVTFASPYFVDKDGNTLYPKSNDDIEEKRAQKAKYREETIFESKKYVLHKLSARFSDDSWEWREQAKINEQAHAKEMPDQVASNDKLLEHPEVEKAAFNLLYEIADNYGFSPLKASFPIERGVVATKRYKDHVEPLMEESESDKEKPSSPRFSS